MEKLRNKAIQTLRWSESFFQADMVYIAKGGFWMVIGQTVSTGISLLLVIAFANLLPKEIYGTYRYILSIAGILNIFSLTGMNSAVSRAVASGDEGSLKTSIRYQLRWNILMMAAFLIIGVYYFLNGDSVFGISFLIMGIFIPLTLTFNTFGAFLEGKKDFRLANISTIISTLIYALGILIAMSLSKEVIWLIFAYSATTLLSTFIFYWYTLHKYNPPDHAQSDTINYGRKLTFIGFIGPISSQIDKIVITQFWGPSQLAIYALAMAIPERVAILIKNWVGLGAPNFATKSPAQINTVFYKRLAQGMAIGSVFSLMYALLSPYFFKFILPQYLDSIFYSQVLSLSFIFSMPNRYISLLLESQKLSRAIFIRSIVQSLIIISLYVILGIWGGVLGLVIAFVLNSFIGMLVNIWLWRRSVLRL